MKASAIAPGTCGELVQGVIENMNFHITCPVNCFSKIQVEIRKDDYIFINDPTRTKVIQGVTKTMQFLTKRVWGAAITIETQLPVSKGMASSTADISAACFATAQALGYELSPHEIAKIALSIEPSDGLFFPGIVAFDHVKGNYYKEIGKALELNLFIYDFGGEIDTIVFNKRPDLKEKNFLNETKAKEAFRTVEKGLRTSNEKLIAKGATISALANQNIIFKPQLEEIIDTVLQAGGLGLNTAHSGTLIGIFYNEFLTDKDRLTRTIQKKFPHLAFLGQYKLIDGGVNVEFEEEEFCSSIESTVVT
ncbi:MAG: GHMP kinase [Peptococcaceae bacterium]